MADLSEPLALLFRALESPLGILVQSESLDSDLAKLYKARASQPEFARLQFRRTARDTTQLLIVKGPASVAPSELELP